MNRVIFLSLFLLLLTGAFAQQGWRSGEMEVNVFLKNQQEANILKHLCLETELASPDATVIRAFLIPQELERLRSSGLNYKVIIPDLNQYYSNFWSDQLVPPGYHSYEQIVALADSLAAAFPIICKKVIFGTSSQYRQLAALKISDNVYEDEPEPEIMFDGGIHGDEIGGAENLIRYARDLCLGYGNDTTYTNLINSREIWLYYMVNPDGRASMSRYNANGVDINRDAGYMWNAEGGSSGPFSQKESKALRECMLENQFVVYTNYHSGTEVISYPWSYRGNSTSDVAHINELAGVYSASSGYSNLLYGQGYNIMYAINGSYKDVQYGCFGNVGWSIEISANKQPPASQIMTYYNYNVPAMTEMINRAGYGVEGFVTDSLIGTPIPATIWVNNYYPVKTDPIIGDYHKYLLPGSYTIKVTTNGYKPKTISNVTVPATGSVIVDFQLVADPKCYAYRVISCQIPGNNFGDEGYTPGSLGAPDGISYSLGKNGWIIIEMGDTVHDGAGNDLKVFEGGTPDEGFSCFASITMDGPWLLLGNGTGTASFNLSSGPMDKARYFRIKDDGDGSAYGADIGYDLDAVEILTLPLSADFTANDTTTYEGSPVNFTDISSGTPVSWNWIFPGGTPGGSIEKNPAGIIYDTAGTYDVTLSISNGLSFSTLTKTDYINVINCTISTLPFTESFSGTTIPTCWTQVDNQSNGQIWQFGTITGQSPDPALIGNYAYLNSYDYGSGNSQNADLITPTLDLSAYITVTLQFNHYFLAYTGSSGKLSYSINNGISWTLINTFTTTSPTNPAAFSQAISVVAGQSQVKFKWNYTGTCGYYWAVDDVQIICTPSPVSVSIAPSENPVLAGTSVTFTATPTNGGTTPVYQWMVNGTNVGTNNATYTYTPLNNDSVTCMLTSNEICPTGNPATSNTVTMIVNLPTIKVLNLKVYLEGLYDDAGTMRQAYDATGPHFGTGIADHVIVELHYATVPYGVAYTYTDVNLNTDGTLSIRSIPLTETGSYYIVVKNRNHIETWSAAPVAFTGGGPFVYDFSTAASQAYGSNMKQMGTVYAVWAGDVTRDGRVDGSDISSVDNACTSILKGYVAEDANGDGYVDGSDMAIVDNNSTAIVTVIKP